MQRQRRRFVSSAVLCAVLLAAVTACGGAKSVQAVANLRGVTDEAGVLMGRAADPSDFTVLSQRMDDILKEVPTSSSLSADERAIVDLAARRTAALKELASMLGASDEVMGWISQDAVELVSASMIVQPSTAFRQHLDNTVNRLLKDTSCTMFADAMSASSASPSPLPGVSSPASFGPPTQRGLWADLEDAVAAANYRLDDVNRVVDLAGLSSGILSTATGYVSRVKKTMDAATWESSGALQAYLRHCLR